MTTRHPVQFTWRHTTQNHGKKKSPVTDTGLEFVTMDGKERILDQVRVPPLAKDEAAKGGQTFTENIDTRYGYGTYLPRICADPKGSSPRNLTRATTARSSSPTSINVAPFAVNGTVSGNVELFPGVTLRWNGNVSGQFTDGLDSAEGGVVDYTFVSGAVSYTVAGIRQRLLLARDPDVPAIDLARQVHHGLRDRRPLHVACRYRTAVELPGDRYLPGRPRDVGHGPAGDARGRQLARHRQRSPESQGPWG